MSEQRDEVPIEAAEPVRESHRGEHNELGFYSKDEEQAQTEAAQPRRAGHDEEGGDA